MPDLDVRPYVPADDAAAVELEVACVQGRSLALRFRRPAFAARSAVYEDAAIFCGWLGGRLVGTVAAARKPVELRGRTIQATYFYDLRVHPDARGQGLSHDLIRVALAEQAADAECRYVLVAGQNERMLGLLRGGYHHPHEVSISLVYACVPVYRRRGGMAAQVDPAEVRARHLAAWRPTFRPAYRPERMVGHVASYAVDGAGCSVWTNEALLAEEVVRLPSVLRGLGRMADTLRPLVPLPRVPRQGEAIPSWFLYDVYADSEAALGRLLDAVSDAALEAGRTVLYLLLRPGDPLLAWTRAARRLMFTLPYRFLARGTHVPDPQEPLYLDIRDL